MCVWVGGWGGGAALVGWCTTRHAAPANRLRMHLSLTDKCSLFFILSFPLEMMQVRTTRQYARDAVVVDAKWLPELAPAFFARQQARQELPAVVAVGPGRPNDAAAVAGRESGQQQQQRSGQKQEQRLPLMANGIGPGARGTYRAPRK